MTASAATPGRACLFNSPNGVSANGIVGHMGWAFKSGAGDNWVYGATEGTGSPLVDAGKNTNTWQRNGTWDDVLYAFGSGINNGKGIGYYTSYRCKDVRSSEPTLAYNQAITAARSGYHVLNDNCLTKAVDILRVYGLADMHRAASTAPNSYYGSLPEGDTQWHRMTYLLTVAVTLQDPSNSAWVNTQPAHNKRPLRAQFLNDRNSVVGSSSVTAVTTARSTRYVATLSVPLRLADGAPFQVKLKLDYTLWKTSPEIAIAARTSGLQDVRLTVGDVNEDNRVDTTDYNRMMQCYSDLSLPKGPCSSALKRASDINDDRAVNGIDYNLLLRTIQNRAGA